VPAPVREPVAQSAGQPVEQALERLRETESLIHAYAHVDADGARAAAEVAEAVQAAARARAAGAAAPGAVASLGPLHGAPFAVKEVIGVAGMPAACGCRALSGRVSTQDAAVVRVLREAGAVLIGTHVTHELTVGLDEPVTRNPWALERYPGGSSAGGGASVAVGSARFALGTDAAGSVRIPAAMTGVVGLKPTAGRVSAEGVARLASAPSIDHVGILARSVADVAAVLAAIADVERVPPPAGLTGLRIATLGPDTRAALRELAVPEPDVEAAVAEACEELRRLGAELVEVELPSFALAPEAVSTFFAAELAEVHRELVAERPQDYHDGVRAVIEQGLAIPPAQVAAAVRVRDTIKDELREALGAAHADALATPTTPRAAMPLATFDPATELGTLIPYTCPFNLTGQPAVSLPCGFTREGLPVGLQIVGRPCAEALVLRIAGAYERATPWSARQPALP
jgi:Asp-tRNA(Asn)/Glu-tRNA(Gln) amidotransferase A subunit family amidase